MLPFILLIFPVLFLGVMVPHGKSGMGAGLRTFGTEGSTSGLGLATWVFFQNAGDTAAYQVFARCVELFPEVRIVSGFCRQALLEKENLKPLQLPRFVLDKSPAIEGAAPHWHIRSKG